MNLATILENQNIEKRIAITPQNAKKYINLGLSLSLQKNYGFHLGFSDEEYKTQGVTFLEDYKDYKPSNTIEPELLNNEKAVSSDMENQLQNSINLALKSLENQEIITSDKSFYLYLGSFESAENADKKLLAVKKIDDLNLVTNFSIKKNMNNNTINNYSVISNNYFFYEKALDHCEVVLKHNLDCKIISDI